MKKILLLILTTITLNLFGQTRIADLTQCLQENSINPKDYILNLFEDNDIVIIGERDHKDTTQYNLLMDIFSDKRFIDKVGFIYTEVGCINRTDWANRVLKSNYKSNDEFEKKLIKLYRELDFNPLWVKYNMYKYLKGIYSINKNLDTDRKLTIGFTDLEFDWKDMTRKKYKNFNSRLYSKSYYRDSVMAVNFINLYEEQARKTGKRKALLIQNLPHAINLNLNSYGAKHRTTGSYIVDKYKEKVKIAIFNSIYFSKKFRLIDDGQWDAAFEKTDCKPVGFNIENTKIGSTSYEEEFGLNFKKVLGVDIKFEDVVDGIIFYEPFYKFKPTNGIPNVVDKKFSSELMDRTIMFQSSSFNRWGLRLIRPFYKKKNDNFYNKVRTFDYYKDEALKQQLNKWIIDKN